MCQLAQAGCSYLYHSLSFLATSHKTHGPLSTMLRFRYFVTAVENGQIRVSGQACGLKPAGHIIILFSNCIWYRIVLLPMCYHLKPVLSVHLRNLRKNINRSILLVLSTDDESIWAGVFTGHSSRNRFSSRCRKRGSRLATRKGPFTNELGGASAARQGTTDPQPSPQGARAAEGGKAQLSSSRTLDLMTFTLTQTK